MFFFNKKKEDNSGFSRKGLTSGTIFGSNLVSAGQKPADLDLQCFQER